MKAILLITALIVLSGLFLFSAKPTGAPLFTIPAPSSTAKPSTRVEVTYSDKTYSVNYFEVKDNSKLELFPNFDNPKTTAELLEEKKCKALISGGFYLPENEPTGLFIYNGKMLKDYETNDLLNGVVGVTFGEKSFIDTRYPIGSTRIAVQTGPLLITEGKELNLTFKDEENMRQARRMVAGLTTNGTIVFMTFYSDISKFGGPILDELPGIVSAFAQKVNLEFESAVNLDGGNHSAFVTTDASLSELTYIGSYFCELQ